MTHKKIAFQNNTGTSMSALNFNGESGKPSSLHCLKTSSCVFLHASNDFALMVSGIPTKVNPPLEPGMLEASRAGEKGLGGALQKKNGQINYLRARYRHSR